MNDTPKFELLFDFTVDESTASVEPVTANPGDLVFPKVPPEFHGNLAAALAAGKPVHVLFATRVVEP